MKIDNNNLEPISGGQDVFDLNLKNLCATEDKVFRAQAGFSEDIVGCTAALSIVCVPSIIC